MLEITWYDEESDFTIDWAKDYEEMTSSPYVKQQIYALIMGWA